MNRRVMSLVAMVAVLLGMMLASAQVSAAPASQATAAATQGAVTAKVIVEQLSVRAQPSIRAVRVTVLKAGDSVTLTAQTVNGTWYQVTTADGKQGWVGSAYVFLTSGKDSDVPQVASPDVVEPSQCVPPSLTGRVNSVDGLALRDAPSNKGVKLATLPAGTVVTASGQNSAGTWLFVTVGSGATKQTGWVGSAYVFFGRGNTATLPIINLSVGPSTPSAATATALPDGCPTPLPGSTTVPTPSTEVKGTVNVDSLRIRAFPSTDSDTLKILKAGEKVTVLGQNEAGTWFQVQTDDNIVGWAGSAYIVLSGIKLSEVPKIQPTPAG